MDLNIEVTSLACSMPILSMIMIDTTSTSIKSPFKVKFIIHKDGKSLLICSEEPFNACKQGNYLRIARIDNIDDLLEKEEAEATYSKLSDILRKEKRAKSWIVIAPNPDVNNFKVVGDQRCIFCIEKSLDQKCQTEQNDQKEKHQKLIIPKCKEVAIIISSNTSRTVYKYVPDTKAVKTQTALIIDAY